MKDCFDVVSLAEAIEHLRIDDGDDNDYIEDLIEDAVEFCLTEIGYDYEMLETKIPKQIRRAALLLIGDWYENRMEDSDRRKNTMNFGAQRLLNQIKPMRLNHDRSGQA